MNFIVGKPTGIVVDSSKNTYFLKLLHPDHIFLYNAFNENTKNIYTHTSVLGEYRVDLSHLKETFEDRKQGHEDFTNFDDFIEKLSTLNIRDNVIIWDTDTFTPDMFVNQKQKTFTNLNFPAIDKFVCQDNNTILSTPIAYFRETPIYTQTLAQQYYPYGMFIGTTHERAMHDELVAILLNDTLYCQKERLTEALINMMFRRM